MIALLQRVTSAAVTVAGVQVAHIDTGVLLFLGVERGDEALQADRLLERVLSYRLFADDTGRMNQSVQMRGGGLLVVPQFTLAADTKAGTRAGFSHAATPTEGLRLFEYFVQQAKQRYSQTQQGVFGADMQVSLVNDGPVTFWLQVAPTA